MRALAGVESTGKPGARHEYSSPNYLVLASIIEQVSGLTFEQYVQRHIFDPLGMAHSHTSQENAIGGGMTSGHRYWFGFPQPARLRYEADRMPTAALVSSAGDLAKFLVAQLNSGVYAGRQILSKNGVEQMHHPGVGAEGFSYAMGWRVTQLQGTTAISHGGIVPHFRGKMVFLPDAGWGVAYLTNVSSALPAFPTSHRVADTIAASLTGAPLPAEADSSLKRMYLWIVLGMALITLSQIRDLIRFQRWRERQKSAGAKQIAWQLVAGILLPIAILFGLPSYLKLPFAEMLRSMPDVTLWLFLTVALALIIGVRKVRALSTC